jgi:RES domain-containing protein
MKVYRISKCNYIDDLSGTGAALFGGRWNSKRVYILYTAATASLALLETIVHTSAIPREGFCLLELEIPENKILEVKEKQLPSGWQTYPAPSSLKTFGDDFIQKGSFLALKIPSAVLSEEFNYLLNPGHPDFKKIKINKKKTITIDGRLRS